jgi:sec-independent protein translocase protein TatA
MFGVSHWELLIIFLIVLLIFGARRIPDMAQGLGRGIKEFRKAMRDAHEETPANGAPPPHQPVAAPPPQPSVAQRAQTPPGPAPKTADTPSENQYS